MGQARVKKSNEFYDEDDRHENDQQRLHKHYLFWLTETYFLHINNFMMWYV